MVDTFQHPRSRISRPGSPTEALLTAAVLAALAASVPAQLQFDDSTPTHMPADNDSTSAVALGDVDGDGDLDMVLANSNGQNRLYLNDGTGTFTDGTAARMPTDNDATLAVALGDADGDGNLDMVFGNAGSPRGQNRLYLNDGTGRFADATAMHMPADNDSTRAVALGDVDGDGDLDMVFGNRWQQNRLYLNDGAGFFTDATATRMPADNDGTNAVALDDVDGDGDLDAVSGNYQQQNRLYLNGGTGTFTDATASMPADRDPTMAVVLGDVDTDGDLDMLHGNGAFYFYPPPGPGGPYGGFFIPTQNRLYLNDGTGTFVDATSGSLPIASDDTHALALGDVDGDGDLDMVFGGGAYYVTPHRLYLNDGAGTFVDSTAARMPANNDTTRDVALGDVDGDGDLDMVLGMSQQNRLYLNLLRQLDAPSSARIGQTYTLDTYARYGIPGSGSAIEQVGEVMQRPSRRCDGLCEASPWPPPIDR